MLTQIQMHFQLEDQAGSIFCLFASILQFGSQHKFYIPLRTVIQAVVLPLLINIPHSLNGFGSKCALSYLKQTLQAGRQERVEWESGKAGFFWINVTMLESETKIIYTWDVNSIHLSYTTEIHPIVWHLESISYVKLIKAYFELVCIITFQIRIMLVTSCESHLLVG